MQLAFYGTKWALSQFLDRLYPFVCAEEHYEFDVAWEEDSAEEDCVPLFWLDRVSRAQVTINTCSTLGPLGIDAELGFGFGWINYVLKGPLSAAVHQQEHINDDANDDDAEDDEQGMYNDHGFMSGGYHNPQFRGIANDSVVNADPHYQMGMGYDDDPDILELNLPGLRSVQAYQLLTHEWKQALHFNYSAVSYCSMLCHLFYLIFLLI